jgi:putative heme transporter
VATRPVRVVDLDWRSVVVALAAVVALVAAGALVHEAPRTMTSLAIGTLLALALDPLVRAAQRRLGGRRAVAVAAVLVAFTVLLVALAALLAPPAFRQARDLRQQLPHVVRQLDDLPVVGSRLHRAHAAVKVQRWIEDLPKRLAGDTTPITRAGRSVVNGLLSGFLTLLVAVTLLLDGERLLAGARRLVPVARRAEADRIGDLVYRVVGRYVAGSLLVAAIAGLAILMAGLALHVPLTPLLAVWVMAFDLVPQIGGAVGGIPFVALGFSHSAGTGVACAVFFVLYLQLENHVIQPLVVGRTVKLSPPATMTAALVGVSAAGVVGALVAVPVVGAAKVTYDELRSRRRAGTAEPTSASSATTPRPDATSAPGQPGGR